MTAPKTTKMPTMANMGILSRNELAALLFTAAVARLPPSRMLASIASRARLSSTGQLSVASCSPAPHRYAPSSKSGCPTSESRSFAPDHPAFGHARPAFLRCARARRSRILVGPAAYLLRPGVSVRHGMSSTFSIIALHAGAPWVLCTPAPDRRRYAEPRVELRQLKIVELRFAAALAVRRGSPSFPDLRSIPRVATHRGSPR